MLRIPPSLYEMQRNFIFIYQKCFSTFSKTTPQDNRELLQVSLGGATSITWAVDEG